MCGYINSLRMEWCLKVRLKKVVMFAYDTARGHSPFQYSTGSEQYRTRYLTNLQPINHPIHLIPPGMPRTVAYLPSGSRTRRPASTKTSCTWSLVLPHHFLCRFQSCFWQFFVQYEATLQFAQREFLIDTLLQWKQQRAPLVDGHCILLKPLYSVRSLI
jgi:hypothetical protein